MSTVAGKGSKKNATDEDGSSELDHDGNGDVESNTHADLIQLVHDGNAKTAELLFQFTQAEEDEEKQSIFDQIKLGMKVHAQLVEEIYYPLVTENADEEDKEDAEELVYEAQAGNYVASMLLDDLSDTAPSDDLFEGKMTILCELAKKQTKREEKEMFDKLKAADVDLKEGVTDAEELKSELEEALAAPPKKSKSKAKSNAKAKTGSKTSAKLKQTSSAKTKGKSSSGQNGKSKVTSKKSTAKAKTKAKTAPKVVSKTSATKKRSSSVTSKPAAKSKKETKAKSGSNTSKTGKKPVSKKVTAKRSK